MPFDKRTLVLPKGTRFEERTIVTTGDLILGNHVQAAYGLRTDGRLFAGQGASVEGDVRCGGDLRADQSCHLLGNVEAGANVYLGERSFVKGDVSLEGDLDVGDDVRIGGQLKAKGWVQKRSPVPLVIYLFIYLLELLRLGQSEEVARILKEMEGADEIAVSEVFLFVPDHSRLGIAASEVKGGLLAKEDCRILGNLTVRGDAELGAGTKVCGALRADGAVRLRRGAEVQGDLVAGGPVVIGEGCTVLGDLTATSVEMYASSTVDGKILAEGGIRFRTEERDARIDVAEQKVDAFAGKAADLVDLLG